MILRFMCMLLFLVTNVTSGEIAEVRYETTSGQLCLKVVFRDVCTGSCAPQRPNFTVDASQLQVIFTDGSIYNFTSDDCSQQPLAIPMTGITDDVCATVGKRGFDEFTLMENTIKSAMLLGTVSLNKEGYNIFLNYTVRSISGNNLVSSGYKILGGMNFCDLYWKACQQRCERMCRHIAAISYDHYLMCDRKMIDVRSYTISYEKNSPDFPLLVLASKAFHIIDRDLVCFNISNITPQRGVDYFYNEVDLGSLQRIVLQYGCNGKQMEIKIGKPYQICDMRNTFSVWRDGNKEEPILCAKMAEKCRNLHGPFSLAFVNHTQWRLKSQETKHKKNTIFLSMEKQVFFLGNLSVGIIDTGISKDARCTDCLGRCTESCEDLITQSDRYSCDNSTHLIPTERPNTISTQEVIFTTASSTQQKIAPIPKSDNARLVIILYSVVLFVIAACVFVLAFKKTKII